jgi:hypothetical protein
MRTQEWNFSLTRPKPSPSVRVSFDLETALIAPLVQAPPVVALGFSVDGGKVHLVAANDTAFDRVVEELFTDPSVRLFGHNCRFDVIALLAHGARWGMRREWADMLFSALSEDRVTCTQLREKLIHIAKANPRDMGRKFNLGASAEHWKLPTQPDKTDPWRLKWGELAHLRVDQYPAEAVKYLVEDVRSCDELYRAQNSRPEWLKDQYRQTRASVALGLMSAWGLSTDPEVVSQVYAETVADIELAREICLKHGLVRPNGVKDKKAAEQRQIAAYAKLGLPVPVGTQTEKMVTFNQPPNVKLDEESCLKSGDPVMRAYTKLAQSQTLLAKVERLMHPVIQPFFDPLMETGRTSCSQGTDPKPGEAPTAYGSQVQNVPRDVTHTCTECEGTGCEACNGKGEVPGTAIRGCYRARTGCVLLDIDYAAMELRTLAQVERWWFGESTLGDILNDVTRCPHVEAGAMIKGMDVKEAYALKKRDPKAFKNLRQLAKAVNFGTPGGMGARRLADYAQQAYNVPLSEEEAKEILRVIRRVYPERGPYLQRVADWAESGGGRYRFTQPYSDRVRGGLTFSVGANTPFQGLAADAAKEAMWRVAVHCYVLEDSALYECRPVAFVHDQILVEAPEGSYAEAAKELQVQWCGGAQAVVPDIIILAEPAAMRNWSKDAGDPVFTADGTLAVYEDRKEAASG